MKYFVKNCIFLLLSSYVCFSTAERNTYVDLLRNAVYFANNPGEVNTDNILRWRVIYNELRNSNPDHVISHLTSTYNREESDLSSDCMNQILNVISAAKNRDTWALKMLDAAGKPGGGILEGNQKWMGDYDECLSIDERNGTDLIQGRYCFIVLPFNNKHPSPFAGVQAYMLDWGLCVPRSCSADDTKAIFNLLIEGVKQKIPALNITSLRVLFSSCSEEDRKLDSYAIGGIVVFSILGAVILLSTLYDILAIQRKSRRNMAAVNSDLTITESEQVPLIKGNRDAGQKKQSTLDKTILSFSAYSNAKKILNTDTSTGSLSALNGVRFFSISWVVLGHNFSTSLTFLSNITSFMDTVTNRLTYQAIANALVAVDSFFALSGLLLAYLTLREMKRIKEKGRQSMEKNIKFWLLFYFHRFWRLTPAYMLVLMMNTTVTHYFGNGPAWPASFDQGPHGHCENTWWRNLLYISNFFPFADMCMAWSWYLSNDMQFFVLSPLMLIPLFYSEFVGVVICCLFLLGPTIVTGVISSHYRIPPSFLGGGGSPSGAADYVDKYYIKPWCRIGPYIVGILFGFLLYKTNSRLKINKFLNILLWLGFTVLACLTLYGLYDPIKNNPMNNDVSSLYNSTGRVVWGACVCWVIFACATGNGGFINTLLSWSAFTPLARLSYCTYLVHPIVMMIYYYSLRTPVYMTDLTAAYLFLGHLVCSFMVAFVASLAFEAPMMGLEKVFLRRGS